MKSNSFFANLFSSTPEIFMIPPMIGSLVGCFKNTPPKIESERENDLNFLFFIASANLLQSARSSEGRKFSERTTVTMNEREKHFRFRSGPRRIFTNSLAVALGNV